MPDQWMSIVEYSRTFSISDMTIRRRIKAGKVHAVLRDGKYYIPVKVTDDGKFIPQRKSLASEENDAAFQAPNSTHRPQAMPRVIAGQIGPQHTQPSSSSRSNWNEGEANQKINLNSDAKDTQGLNFSGMSALPNQGNRPASQSSVVGAAALPSYSHSFANNIAQQQKTVPDYSPQMAALAQEVKSMMALIRETLEQLDREKSHYKGEFEQKILTQQEQIKVRDQEVQSLKQKMEDMQLLIKIMESKHDKLEI